MDWFRLYYTSYSTKVTIVFRWTRWLPLEQASSNVKRPSLGSFQLILSPYRRVSFRKFPSLAMAPMAHATKPLHSDRPSRYPETRAQHHNLDPSSSLRRKAQQKKSQSTASPPHSHTQSHASLACTTVSEDDIGARVDQNTRSWTSRPRRRFLAHLVTSPPHLFLHSSSARSPQSPNRTMHALQRNLKP